MVSTSGGLAEGVIRRNATEIGGLRFANPPYGDAHSRDGEVRFLADVHSRDGGGSLLAYSVKPVWRALAAGAIAG
jgi:hypothetical protein